MDLKNMLVQNNLQGQCSKNANDLKIGREFK